MDSAALDEIATELYALPPAQFTAARNARAGDAVGDPLLARAVKALRKPSVAAFAVNAFVRHSPDQLSQALELADALREAQDDLDAATLAELTRQRRALVAALTAHAADAAAELGVSVSAAARDEVSKTINAAMMDAAASDAVMTGRLVRSLEAVGFGEVDLGGATAGTVSARVEPEPRDDLAERRARRAAEKAARQAAQEASDAARELSRAEAVLTAARERADHLGTRIAEVRAELARLEVAAEDADATLARAEDARRAAASAAGRARARADTARRDVDAP